MIDELAVEEWQIAARDREGHHAKLGVAYHLVGNNQGRDGEVVSDGELPVADPSFDAVQLYQKMRDARIGRVLVGSLHQAIGDVLPSRLEFYETWLKPEELRKGSIGQASFSAVLSFLRREGSGEYQDITTRAGQYAADWSFDMLGRGRRMWLGMLPFRRRAKAGLKLARALVRDTHAECRATTTYQDQSASIEIIDSPFCDVRESSESPLCWYFAAATSGLFVRLNLESHAELVSCRAEGGGSVCRIELNIQKRAPVSLRG
jgi:hypothetical protein